MPSNYDYSMRHYGEMVTSEPRMSVYAEALRRAVTPGCTVIDLGASFGPFAILACKYGAGKVIAIEPDPSVELVMPLAMANGCADRIEVFRGLSTHYTPVQKADVLVSDLRGSIPLYQKHIEAIADARTRLLKPGGQQLPLRDTIRVALVSSAGAYRSCVEPWLSNRYDLDLSLGQRFVVNDSMRITLDAKALMSDPHDLVSLDYPTITDPNVDSTVELVATRSATAHGLQMWFDAEIAEGLTFSNAPGEPPLVYGRRFLPFERAVRLKRGDRVTARIRAMLLDIEYIISWHCTITGGATGAVKAIFKQSTFNSKVYPQKDIETYSTAHVPAPGTALAIDRDCLALVGEGRSVAEIARALQRLYPEQLADDRAALNRVTGLLSRYDTGGQ